MTWQPAPRDALLPSDCPTPERPAYATLDEAMEAAQRRRGYLVDSDN